MKHRCSRLVVLAAILATVLMGARGRQCRAPENEPGIPPGPYLETCRACGIEESGEGSSRQKMLVCGNCPDDEGRNSFTEAPLAGCEEFVNDNGRLRCVKGENADPDFPRRVPLPSGSYRDSCFGCRALRADDEGEGEGKVRLQCESCRKGEDEVLSSFLVYGAGCEPIENDGGILRCSSASSRPKDEL